MRSITWISRICLLLKWYKFIRVIEISEGNKERIFILYQQFPRRYQVAATQINLSLMCRIAAQFAKFALSAFSHAQRTISAKQVKTQNTGSHSLVRIVLWGKNNGKHLLKVVTFNEYSSPCVRLQCTWVKQISNSSNSPNSSSFMHKIIHAKHSLRVGCRNRDNLEQFYYKTLFCELIVKYNVKVCQVEGKRKEHSSRSEFQRDVFCIFNSAVML